jgi:hypothetical protein
MDHMARFQFLLSVIPAIVAAVPALAADSMCKMLADANAKIYAVPAHIYQTETAAYTGGKTRSSELIYFNNKTYILLNGKWTVSPATPTRMAEMHKEAENKHPNVVCHVVRDESVNGEAATLYSMHDDTADAKIDSQLWISKSRGLPIKLEMDVGGAAGKSHRAMRYEYTNVQTPAGALSR